MIAFAEHRPETVSGTRWTEYVRLMTAATYGRLTAPGVARLGIGPTRGVGTERLRAC